MGSETLRSPVESKESTKENAVDFLPVFFSITDRACLVVGGGKVARRKVDLLLRAGGRVTVAAPDLDPILAELTAAGRIVHLEAPFHPSMLEGMTLVISATGTKEVNRDVARAAGEAQLPINVVDDLELSTFILPAIVDRSPLVVAVSSGGKSPVLTRLLKARLESLVPVAYGRLAELAGDFRQQVKDAFSDPAARRKFWERAFQGHAASLFLAGRETEARQALEAALAAGQAHTENFSPAGSVTLLQTHREDPELLTLKALRSLQEADVIVHDAGVLKENLDMARRDAERILVGQAPGQRACAPEEAPSLLVELGREGKHVVRIRAGDAHPQSGNEAELQALDTNRIPYRTIPGIASDGG